MGCSSMECVALTFDGPRTQETKLNSLQWGGGKDTPQSATEYVLLTGPLPGRCRGGSIWIYLDEQ